MKMIFFEAFMLFVFFLIFLFYGPFTLIRTIIVIILFYLMVIPPTLTKDKISFDWSLSFFFLFLSKINFLIILFIYIILVNLNPITINYMYSNKKLKEYQRIIIHFYRIPEAILYLYLARYGFPLIFGIHIIINIGIAFYYSILTKTDFKAHLFKLFLFMVIPNLVLYSFFPILMRVLV